MVQITLQTVATNVATKLTKTTMTIFWHKQKRYCSKRRKSASNRNNNWLRIRHRLKPLKRCCRLPRICCVCATSNMIILKRGLILWTSSWRTSGHARYSATRNLRFPRRCTPIYGPNTTFSRTFSRWEHRCCYYYFFFNFSFIFIIAIESRIRREDCGAKQTNSDAQVLKYWCRRLISKEWKFKIFIN